MTIEKDQLREQMKARRAALSHEAVAEASESITRRLMYIEPFREALSVFVYVSIGNEVETHTLIEELIHANKRVSVPRVYEGRVMHAHLIGGLGDLQADQPRQFGIPIPPEEAPIEASPDIALIPGLAFSTTGQRLGYGAGHYDRYLSDRPDTLAVGLCYDWQLVENLPTEPHDRPMRVLVTDQRTLNIV